MLNNCAQYLVCVSDSTCSFNLVWQHGQAMEADEFPCVNSRLQSFEQCVLLSFILFCPVLTWGLLYPKLVSNSLSSWRWPWAPDALASTLWVPGLQAHSAALALDNRAVLALDNRSHPAPRQWLLNSEGPHRCSQNAGNGAAVQLISFSPILPSLLLIKPVFPGHEEQFEGTATTSAY